MMFHLDDEISTISSSLSINLNFLTPLHQHQTNVKKGVSVVELQLLSKYWYLNGSYTLLHHFLHYIVIHFRTF